MSNVSLRVEGEDGHFTIVITRRRRFLWLIPYTTERHMWTWHTFANDDGGWEETVYFKTREDAQAFIDEKANTIRRDGYVSSFRRVGPFVQSGSENITRNKKGS